MGAPEKPKVRDENTVKFVRGQRQDFLRLKQHMDKVLFTRPDDTFACPRCAETIKRAAKVCRYCPRALRPDRRSPSAPPGALGRDVPAGSLSAMDRLSSRGAAHAKPPLQGAGPVVG